MANDDIVFIRMAIDEARKCKPEDTRTHPMVGAVVVKDGKLLAKAFRGEGEPGKHAEYIVFESKLADKSLVGATVYATLEPCTSRNHPKVPCAYRLIERKVARVVIGMLDPNPSITGKGQRLLRDANIVTDLFPPELMAEVEELNREFIRYQKELVYRKEVDEDFIKRYKERPLDEWYQAINFIYMNHNFYRNPMSIFTHLVEVIGGLSLLASSKRKPGLDPQKFVLKVLAWWMTLCGKVGVRSVSDMLWAKFPGVCPYCHHAPHDPTECSERKKTDLGPQWDVLTTLGKSNKPPKSLGEWQLMFSKIYPAHQVEEFGTSFARLTEELGELAESVRIFPVAPGYFLSEASDVFAWLMHIQNIIEHKNEVPKAKRGSALEKDFCLTYPDYCPDCGNESCICPPILEATIGRIAHGVPHERGSFEVGGSFMTIDKVRALFKRPL